MRMPAARRSPGFTLVELLVVMAIIGLLVALLLPALAQARKQTNRVICATRVRSLGQMALMYSGDNRRQLPTHDRVPANHYGNIVGAGFRSTMDKYGLTITNAFCPEVCYPADPTQRNAVWTTWGGTLGYTYYPRMVSNATSTSPRAAVTGDDLRDQYNRQSILFADVHRYQGSPSFVVATSHLNSNRPGNAWSSVLSGVTVTWVAKQPVGLNVGILDNSVRWIAFGDIDTTVGFYSTGAGFNVEYYWSK